MLQHLFTLGLLQFFTLGLLQFFAHKSHKHLLFFVRPRRQTNSLGKEQVPSFGCYMVLQYLNVYNWLTTVGNDVFSAKCHLNILPPVACKCSGFFRKPFSHQQKHPNTVICQKVPFSWACLHICQSECSWWGASFVINLMNLNNQMK